MAGAAAVTAAAASAVASTTAAAAATAAATGIPAAPTSLPPGTAVPTNVNAATPPTRICPNFPAGTIAAAAGSTSAAAIVGGIMITSPSVASLEKVSSAVAAAVAKASFTPTFVDTLKWVEKSWEAVPVPVIKNSWCATRLVADKVLTVLISCTDIALTVWTFRTEIVLTVRTFRTEIALTTDVSY
jgi:hypothetical protein